VYVQTDSYRGAGRNPDEIDGANSCLLLGEQNSVWYTFRVEVGGQLCFTISPIDTVDDYDWALFHLTGTTCAAIATNPFLAVACNWTFNAGCGGATGLDARTDCIEQFSPCLTVQAGETYALNVSNFTASNAGYAIDFSASSAQLYDQQAPIIDSVRSFCSGVSVYFDERVTCASVEAGDFTFTGPDGPYRIDTVQSACQDNNGATRGYDLLIAPAIQQAGTYTLTLTGSVSDLCGNVSSTTETHSVFMPLPPQANLDPIAAQCQANNAFAFTYPGPSAVQGYRWTFGDGGFSVAPTPVHHYESPGFRTVVLTITDQYGCQDSASTEVEVLPSPDARFTLDLPVCRAQPLRLFNLSSAQAGSRVTQQEWQFSDGAAFFEAQPQYALPLAGSYYVVLEVENDVGCIDTAYRSFLVYPTPDAAFGVDSAVCLGEAAQWTYQGALSAYFPGDTIHTWRWLTGDGQELGPETAPSYRYASGDTFPVTLIVETNQGCRDSLTQPQVVEAPEPSALIPDTVCLGEEAHLIARGKPGEVIEWYTQGSGGTPFFTGISQELPGLTTPQTYYVGARSKRGCLGALQPLSAGLYSQGGGGIQVDLAVVAFPQPVVQFSWTGTLTPTTYQWEFGDGGSASEASPSHAYQGPGAYLAQLTLVDDFGCAYDFTQPITVEPLPPVFTPSAFSPNADGDNDTWYVISEYLQSVDLRIYARNGREVIQSNNPGFQWTGQNGGGQPVPEGVYVFVLRGVDASGKALTRQGTITLIR
jgi:gliding motility-associated-like protein